MGSGERSPLGQAQPHLAEVVVITTAVVAALALGLWTWWAGTPLSELQGVRWPPMESGDCLRGRQSLALVGGFVMVALAVWGGVRVRRLGFADDPRAYGYLALVLVLAGDAILFYRYSVRLSNHLSCVY